MADKAKTEYVVVDGQVTGVKFTFGNGKVHAIMLADLSPTVLAHAAANGIREATRDTFAGAASADEAEAAFLKRRTIMVGPSGEYATRGGARIDWLAEIMAAAERLAPMDDATRTARQAALQAVLDAGGDLKVWLAEPKRKGLRQMVDLIRKEKAAERAKAGVKAGADLSW